MAFLVVLGRAFSVQIIESDFYAEQGNRRSKTRVTTEIERGEIQDRSGLTIAASVPTNDLYVVAGDYYENDENAAAILKAIGVQPHEIKNRVRLARSTELVLVKRGISAELANRLAQLKVTGFAFQRSSERVFPALPETAYLLRGATQATQRIGLESLLNSQIASTKYVREVIRDRFGRVVAESQLPSADDAPTAVRTTIDLPTQIHVHRALTSVVRANGLVAASAVVMDARTGEILALTAVHSPISDGTQEQKFVGSNVHPALLNFEPESLFWPVTLSVTLRPDVLQQAQIPTRIRGMRVSEASSFAVAGSNEIDATAFRKLAGDLALRTKPTELWRRLSASGIGRPVDPFGERGSSGRLFSADRWSVSDQAAVGAGRQVQVNVLQLLRAYGAAAGSGVAIQPKLVLSTPENGSPPSEKSLPHTVRDLLNAGGRAHLSSACDEAWSMQSRFSTFALVGSSYQRKPYIVGTAYCSSTRSSLLMGVVLEEADSHKTSRRDLAIGLLASLTSIAAGNKR